MLFGSPAVPREGELKSLPLDQLDANPRQPRRRMDDRGLVELAASITEKGVLEPLIVTPRDGRYLIAAGERRYRASTMAGLTTVPCLVRQLTDTEVLELALIENLQREDLNAVDEAECIKALLGDVGLTFEELGRRLGKTKSYVSLRLSLLEFPEEVVGYLRAGKLSPKHARFLMQLDAPARRITVARRIVEEGLSSRQTQELVERSGERAPRATGRRPSPVREKVARVAPEMPEGSRLAWRDDRVHLTVTAPDLERLAAAVQRALRALLAPRSGGRDGK